MTEKERTELVDKTAELIWKVRLKDRRIAADIMVTALLMAYEVKVRKNVLP